MKTVQRKGHVFVRIAKLFTGEERLLTGNATGRIGERREVYGHKRKTIRVCS